MQGARFTTLCSWQCAAELRRAFKLLGWPLGDIGVSPVFGIKGGDLTELMLDSRGFIAEVLDGIGPVHELTRIPEQKRHERGPLREQLLLESSLLRAYLLGAASPPSERRSTSGSRSGPRSSSISGSSGGATGSDTDNTSESGSSRTEGAPTNS